jgi:hypothetical protein
MAWWNLAQGCHLLPTPDLLLPKYLLEGPSDASGAVANPMNNYLEPNSLSEPLKAKIGYLTPNRKKLKNLALDASGSLQLFDKFQVEPRKLNLYENLKTIEIYKIRIIKLVIMIILKRIFY